MDKSIISRLSRRLKAEKVLLDALVEFVSETQGDDSAPIDREEVEYISNQLSKLHTERKANNAFFKESIKRIIKVQDDAKSAQDSLYK
jgi:hypothetical protein